MTNRRRRPYDRAIRSFRRFLFALLAQGAFFVWLTWPLVISLGTHRPRAPYPNTDFDAPLLAWALAHQTRALLSDPSSLTHGAVFYPSPHALYYGEPAFGALPFFAPAFLATGNPTLALNLTFVLPLVLTAACIHFLARRWTASLAGALLAGWVFLHVPWMLHSWVPSAPNYGILFFLPLLMWLGAEPAPSWSRLLTMFALVVGQAIVSPYLAVAACIALGGMALVRLIDPRTRRLGLMLVGMIVGLMGATALVYRGAIWLHTIDEGVRGRSLWRAAPAAPLTMPSGWLEPIAPTAVSVLALVVIVLGFWTWALGRGSPVATQRRAWGWAGVWIAVGLIFSMPRLLLVGGRFWLGTWGWIVWAVPAASSIREPLRLGIVALMGLTIATAAGWADLARGIRYVGDRLPWGDVLAPVVTSVVWLGLMGAIHHPSAGPFELTPVPDESASPIMQMIERSPGALIELPIFGPIGHAAAMYRAIRHRRPLLNGYSGYWPKDFEERMELACRLPDIEALRRLQAEADLSLILVSRYGWLGPQKPPPNGCPPQYAGNLRWRYWERLAEQGHPGLDLVMREPNRFLFRVRRSLQRSPVRPPVKRRPLPRRPSG